MNGCGLRHGHARDRPKYLRVVATPEHFAVQSGPESAAQSLTCWYFCGEPLYAFDYGLSYAQFDYAGLEPLAATWKAGG